MPANGMHSRPGTPATRTVCFTSVSSLERPRLRPYHSVAFGMIVKHAPMAPGVT